MAARDWEGFGGVSKENDPLSEARLVRWKSMSCWLKEILSATLRMTDFLYTSSLSLDIKARQGGRWGRGVVVSIIGISQMRSTTTG